MTNKGLLASAVRGPGPIPSRDMSRCQLTEPLYCELMVLSILLLVNIRHALNKICFVNCWSGGTTNDRHGVLVVFL